MTDNMKKVAKRVGLPQVSCYPFRRQSGTNIERALDVTTAQKAMDHEIAYSTYHHHYDRGLNDVDATDLIVTRERW
jgi:integrase